jgi:transcriptional regulator with PAS, ATPase and Fis domain
MSTYDTQTDVGSVALGRSGERAWSLTVVHHPEPEGQLGRRLSLLDGEVQIIGRELGQFSGAPLSDPKISRRHVEMRCEAGVLSVTDLGSRNGTLVNGRQVQRTELSEGDVITVGGSLLLAHRPPPYVTPPAHAEIVGVSAACGRVLHRIAVGAPKDVVVLIRGETGVGKELVARAIHAQSGREGAFVAVNCSAIADGVVHSELFGHARGAFSGAVTAREGLVAAAEGGTLLLDEIGDASPNLQATLLRLLEQREYREVGSNQLCASTARFVAATNVDLDRAVTAGRFRADLLGRLDRWVIDVPPLRQRREDVVPLALHFARRMLGRQARLSRSLAHALLLYDWPANVRELESVVEGLVMQAGDADTLTLDDELAARLETDEPAPDAAPMSRRGVRRARPSPEALHARFVELGYNASALALEFGIGRTTLYRWFREAGFDVRDLRDDP